jgi:hypothetical protein
MISLSDSKFAIIVIKNPLRDRLIGTESDIYSPAVTGRRVEYKMAEVHGNRTHPGRF